MKSPLSAFGLHNTVSIPSKSNEEFCGTEIWLRWTAAIWWSNGSYSVFLSLNFASASLAHNRGQTKRMRPLEWFGSQLHERDTNFIGESERGFHSVIISGPLLMLRMGAQFFFSLLNFCIEIVNFFKKHLLGFPCNLWPFEVRFRVEKWYMKCSYVELGIWNQESYDHRSRLWTQFKQLRIEAWKSQDFNGVWTRDLAIPVRRSNQLSYDVTDVRSWSFVSCNEPVKNGCEVIYMFDMLNYGFEIK